MNFYNFLRNKSAETLTFLVLCYGLYAILCQLGMIWLHILFDADLPVRLLVHRYAPMLEYPLMSLLILCVGALLITITCRSEKR